MLPFTNRFTYFDIYLITVEYVITVENAISHSSKLIVLLKNILERIVFINGEIVTEVSSLSVFSAIKET